MPYDFSPGGQIAAAALKTATVLADAATVLVDDKEREIQNLNARVQLLAKALVTCRIALERHRGYSLLEAALTEVDAALAEAGIQNT